MTEKTTKEDLKEKMIEEMPPGLKALVKRARELGVDLLEPFDIQGS